MSAPLIQSDSGPARPFYRLYDLRATRKQPSGKRPAAHQAAALDKLQQWFRSPTPGATKAGLLL